MLRLIVVSTDCGYAVNVGGGIQTYAKTFDLDLPEVEAELKPAGAGQYYTVSLTYELRAAATTPKQEGSDGD